MSLTDVIMKFPEEWNNPEISKAFYFKGLDVELTLGENQLFLDIGVVDNFIDYYNQVVKDYNQRYGKQLLVGSVVVDEHGIPVSANHIYGGIQFSFPVTRAHDQKDHIVYCICYTPKKNSDLSLSFIRGHEEVEAIIDMGLENELIERNLVEHISETDNREVKANLGGICSARKKKYTDYNIFEYMLSDIPNEEDRAHVREAIALAKSPRIHG